MFLKNLNLVIDTTSDDLKSWVRYLDKFYNEIKNDKSKIYYFENKPDISGDRLVMLEGVLMVAEDKLDVKLPSWVRRDSHLEEVFKFRPYVLDKDFNSIMKNKNIIVKDSWFN